MTQTQTDLAGSGTQVRPRWWLQLVVVVGFYEVYSYVRRLAHGSEATAFAHAKELIQVERWLGLYHEETLQDLALHAKPLIVGLNYFYGSMHFAVTVGVLVFLFVWRPRRYVPWRNVLAITTALALIGFAFWPLMPPRLLPEHFGFVDTLARYPTFWDLQSGSVADAANPYAAMPSLHFGWSSFCALVIWVHAPQRWVRWLGVAYPIVTLVAIVLTGNHFFLDAAGGVAILVAGFLLAHAWDRFRDRPSALAELRRR